MIELSWGDGTNKSHRYGELLRAIMADQLAWIRDHSHARKITEDKRPRFAGRRLCRRPVGPGVDADRTEEGACACS